MRIKSLVFGVIALLCVCSALSLSVTDLINSYEFSYSDGSKRVIGIYLATYKSPE